MVLYMTGGGRSQSNNTNDYSEHRIFSRHPPVHTPTSARKKTLKERDPSSERKNKRQRLFAPQQIPPIVITVTSPTRAEYQQPKTWSPTLNLEPLKTALCDINVNNTPQTPTPSTPESLNYESDDMLDDAVENEFRHLPLGSCSSA